MKKKILITGGAGYIGSMLASKLVNLGHEVTVIDLLKYTTTSLNHLFLSKNFKLIVGDVRNKKLINKEIKKNEIAPATDYLFNGVEKSSREKTFEKLETLKGINTIFRT